MSAAYARIPVRFYDDHAERGLPTPAAVGRVHRVVIVDAADPALPELLSDARFYADPNGPDELPPGLKASAERTVRAIRQALAERKP
jgi:hypothetical protein